MSRTLPVVFLNLDGLLNTGLGRRWAAERDAPTLLVPIDPAAGWARADVDRVLAWCREVTR